MSTAFRRTASVSAALAVGLGSLLSFAAPASAGQATGQAPVVQPGATGVIDVFNINDFHGRIDTDYTGNLGKSFACTLEGAKAKYGEGNSFFVAAGDNIGATTFTSSSQDDNPTIDYLNALQLQATAAGNHEFDKGWTDLRDRVVPRAEYDIVAANVTETATGESVLKPYRIVEVNGLKVGIIGAVTSETPSLTGPGTEMLTFSDPVAAVNKVADQLTDGDTGNGEADVLIAEYHEGAPESDPPATLQQMMAASSIFSSIVNKTSAKVSAIMTGHTHKSYAWDAPMPDGDGTRPILQTGSYASFLGHAQLTFDVATKKLKTYALQNIPVPAKPAADCPTGDPQYAAAAEIVEDAVTKAKQIGQQSIGSVTGDITTAYIGDTRDDRSSESTLSNMLAQSMVDALNEPGRSGAQIGVMNPGGVRAELLYNDGTNATGDITYGEASAVVPFANTLQTVELTGAQFKAVLEQQWQPATSSRPFLKVGLSQNVTYTFDPDRAAGDRITSIVIAADGVLKPIDPAATYTVVGASFLIGGGDNFTAFKQGANVKDTGLIDTEAFINWVKANSPLSPSFAKQAVVVRELPTTVVAGQAVKFQAQGFDLTSRGAPVNTDGTVLLNGTQIGTFEIVDGTIVTSTIQNVAGKGGVATIDAMIPYATPAGPAMLQLVGSPLAAARASAAALAAEPGATTVSIPLTITAPTPTITIDSPVQPGGSTNVTVSGFPAGAVVDIAIDGKVIAQVTVGADGTYIGVLTVPNDVSGAHTITATSGSVSASAPFEVVSGGTEPSTPTSPSPGTSTPPVKPGAPGAKPPMASGKRAQIAYTGTDVGPQLALAGLLLVAGATFALTGRRRKA